jgi:alcohol dehydrogenase (cytochrome c)
VTVAVGWGSLVGDGYPDLFGEPYTSMPTDQGYLVTYALP